MLAPSWREWLGNDGSKPDGAFRECWFQAGWSGLVMPVPSWGTSWGAMAVVRLSTVESISHVNHSLPVVHFCS